MTDRIDPKAIADELRAFTSQWRKNPLNGDEIYGLHWMAEGEEMSARITATGMARAADTIDALVKERDELAAVIDTAKDDLDGAWVSADGTPLGEYLLEVHRALSAAPTDALAEHDARLIESLADEWSEWETFTASDGHRSIRQHGLSPDDWLRARAQQIREERADG